MNAKRWQLSGMFLLLLLLVGLPALNGPVSLSLAGRAWAGPLQGGPVGNVPEDTQSFAPARDGYAVRTWARSHVNGDNHDGEGLLVQDTPDEFRRSYLQFDLSSLEGQGISLALLRLYKTAGPAEPASLFVHRVEEVWFEDTLGITDTTTPWLWDGLVLVSETVGITDNTWLSLNLTGEVNRVLHGDSTPAGILNLGLSTEFMDHTWGATPLTFADSEAAMATERPELVVYYSGHSPFAEAGPDQTDTAWILGNSVQLDGSASGDPDQAAATLYYSWRFLHLPGGSSLTCADVQPNDGYGTAGADRPSFTPDVQGTYILMLTVRDASGLRNVDQVTVELTQALPAHPRVWLTPERLSGLRQRAGGGDASWTRLQGALDAHMGDGYEDLGYAQNNWMIQYALGYQVLQLSNPSQAQAYAGKAIELAQYVLDNVPPIYEDSWLYFGDRAAGLAIVYDWCYDRLSPTQRGDLIDQMNAWVAEAFAMPPTILPDAYYMAEHRPGNNRYYAHFYGRAIVGLATLGENEPLAQQYMDAVKQQSRYEILPFRLRYGAGGGWSEGWNYFPGAMLHTFLVSDAYRTVYGVDAFRETPFPKEMIYFLLHATLPDLSHGTPEGDLWETQAQVADLHRAVMLVLVNEYEGDLAARYGQYWLENSTTVVDAHSTPGEMYDPPNFFYDFVWGDPSRPTSSFDALARHYLARGTGLGFARSAWDAAATWVSFTCGGFVTDHLHQGHGHVNLWRGEWLSVDGNYGATNYGYNHEACLHNVVTVNEQDVITGTNQASYSVARITHQEGNDLFDYVRGNLTPVMEFFDGVVSGQYVQMADHYSREVLYLLPDTVVLLDRVRASDPAYFKRWQLNVPTQPVIDGTLITAVGAQGQSKLFVRSLLPQGAAISSVALSDINDWAGLQGWQVRVRPAAQQTDDLFLHVLYAADAAAAAMPDTVRIDPASGEMVGMHMAAAPRNFLVLFSADPLAEVPAPPIVYTYSPTADTLHVLAGMSPNTGYDVSVSAAGSEQTATVSAGGDLLSSSEGILAFWVDDGGQVRPAFYRIYLPLLVMDWD